MEYIFPSQFNQQGFNVLSPIVNGGVGSTTPPPFRYNGGTVQETAYQNNVGNATYSSMPQIGQILGTQYAQNFSPFMNQPTESQVQTTKEQYYKKAYNDGLISISDYCYYGNAGYNVNNQPTQQPINPFGSWYSQGMNTMAQQQIEQKRVQEEYQNQLFVHNMLCKVAASANGKEYDPDELNKRIQKQQEWERYYFEKAKQEQQASNFKNFIYSLPNSTQKNYVSPIQAGYSYGWYKLWHERNDKYPENYGIDEFFNGGIMGNQIIDEYDRIAKDNEKKLDRLYDRQDFRNYMHSLHPEYDPVAGAATNMGWKLGIDDLSISVPPELAKNEYLQRRQKFMDTIFADNRLNLLPRNNIPQPMIS